MVSIRIASVLLGFLLGFVTISGSVVHTQEVLIGKETAVDENRFLVVATGGATVVDQVELDHTAAAAHIGKKLLKGRKMVAKNVVKEDEAAQEEDVKGGASKMNSGKGKDALKTLLGTSQIGMINNQKLGRKLKPMASHSVDVQTTKMTPNTDSAHADATNSESSISQDSHDPDESIEPEKLLKAAMETMDMLTMDYRQTPRGKPPINNGHPSSGTNANP